jgi:hypothetical protein
VRVVKQRENGIVRRVVLLDDRGDEVAPVNRFLSHLTDSDYSPNTVCATPTTCGTWLSSLTSTGSAGMISGRRRRWSSWPTCGGCRPGVRRSGLA